jgi:DNA adenine methylase
MIPMVSDIIYTYLQRTGGRYIEPFAGGAAVALDLGLPNMIVADLCEPLINCYVQVCNCPHDVFTMVEQYRARGTDKAAYYEVRNKLRPADNVERAAWLFYLNALCWNGVFRENAKGVFNVPYGARSKKLITLERMLAFREAMPKTEFLYSDFAAVINTAKEGDFVFADPPYMGVFSRYLRQGFGTVQHIRLARALQAATERGVAFLAANNDLPEVRNLYRWGHTMRTEECRRVNSDGKGRGKVDCLLIASAPELLPSNT